jgi:hypothetical protein
VIDAAADVLDAVAGDLEAAGDALTRVFPAGTIDPAGDDVDLGRRFVVALPRDDAKAARATVSASE